MNALRRLPVIQNTATPTSNLGPTARIAALMGVAGLCWALLLWGFSGLGWWVIAASCFTACALSGAVVGSQIPLLGRGGSFARSGVGFGLVVVTIAWLGGALPSVTVFGASFLTVSALSTAGFFVGGWFLTFRR